MFSAPRTFALALALLWWAGAFLSQPAALAAGKPRDFGTTYRVDGGSRESPELSLSISTTITNAPVCTAPNDQNAPVLVEDAGGQTIALWSDLRDGNLDVYVQRLNAAGASQWAGNGVPACKAVGNQSNPQGVSDGAGGVILVWQDERAGAADIYAQRISSLGNAVWTKDGVQVCGAANAQRNPVAVPDGLGGVIVAWVDERGAAADIYAQRLNASGAAQWTPNGVALCAATGAQDAPKAEPDGAGGIVACWEDRRGADADIYAQRANASGAPQWTANGVVVCATSGDQETPAMTLDGAGGVIATWSDGRGTNADIYAQRLNGAGAAQWTGNGVLLCGAAGDQKRPQLCTDAANGALVVWEDRRTANADVYARRVSGAGVPQWALDGVGVCNATSDQVSPAIALDPTGGAVVAWTDSRTAANAKDIYAQRLQVGGAVLWTPDGVLVCDAGNKQDAPAVLGEGTGGAMVAWRDRRGGFNTDVYSQFVDASGLVTSPCSPPDSLVTDLPVSTSALQNHRTFRQTNFFWAGVAVRGIDGDWDLETYDTAPIGMAPYPTCFGLPLAGSYGSSNVEFIVGNFNDNHTPPARYNVRAWRYGGSGDATLEWDDGPDELDPNVAYTSPAGWTGPIDVFDIQLSAGTLYTVELTHDPAMDLRAMLFTSYGAPGYYYFAPRSESVLEMGGRFGQYTAVSSEFYGLVITNENGVPGPYTVKVWSTLPVGVDGGAPKSTGLRGFVPNPTGGAVQIDFALQNPGEVSFHIYDMAGRRVAAIPEKHWQQGAWRIRWDGAGARGESLSPGVYFVQMNVDGRRVGVGRLALIP